MQEALGIALSSNLHPAGFDELMPKTIANATVDRLLHHAHIVMTAGDSFCLTQATVGKGVKRARPDSGARIGRCFVVKEVLERDRVFSVPWAVVADRR